MNLSDDNSFHLLEFIVSFTTESISINNRSNFRSWFWSCSIIWIAWYLIVSFLMLCIFTIIIYMCWLNSRLFSIMCLIYYIFHILSLMFSMWYSRNISLSTAICQVSYCLWSTFLHLIYIFIFILFISIIILFIWFFKIISWFRILILIPY